MGKFKPGKSGNPAGRPKNAMKGMAKYIREQTGQGKDLVDFVMKVFNGEPVKPLKTARGPVLDGETGEPVMISPDMEDMKWAAQWLADRGFGRPVQSIEMDLELEGGSAIEDQIKKLPPEKLFALQNLLEEVTSDESE